MAHSLEHVDEDRTPQPGQQSFFFPPLVTMPSSTVDRPQGKMLDDHAATSPTLSHSSSSSSIATLRSPPTPPDEQVLPPPALTDKPTATLDDGHRPSTPKAAASRTHAHFLSLTVDEDGQPRARPAPWKRAYSEADAPWRAAHLAKVAELLREAQRANGVLQGDEGEAWRHSWMEDEAGGVD